MKPSERINEISMESVNNPFYPQGYALNPAYIESMFKAIKQYLDEQEGKE